MKVQEHISQKQLQSQESFVFAAKQTLRSL